MGRARPGNLLVVGERLYWPVISLESETDTRPAWLRVVRDVVEMNAGLPAAGILTTDVKPRLWPRAKAVTLGSFGLYVHAPEYDVSEFRYLDLATVERIARSIICALRLGFTKADIYRGLWRNYKLMRQLGTDGISLERMLASLRDIDEFVPALVVAGLRKEEKGGATRSVERAAAARSQTDQERPRLL